MSISKMMRKASVAVTGGALVVVGLPLIPMPTPGGVVVVGGGMALLATEFPAAQRALDKSRESLAKMVGEESDEEDEETIEKMKTCEKIADLVFRDAPANDEKKVALTKFLPAKMQIKKKDTQSKRQTLDKIINLEELEKFKMKTFAATKGTKRNVKKFIRGTVIPLMARVTSKDEGDSDTKKKVEDEKPTDGVNAQRLRLPTESKLLDK
eukprot:CAMPEP_0197234694 /NCGR_PEP_ID=MMETSP1429-20130617/2384_1 /TAXON_ID=49237 /ORGANISM="Chaetoceros  sp., Strain UNC1202" /LENGTH=209 /DNA_ID=CAMNT_0042693165 /DNA_START=54 /DNA_END=683 /DNA_ORIENTATION=-